MCNALRYWARRSLMAVLILLVFWLVPDPPLHWLMPAQGQFTRFVAPSLYQTSITPTATAAAIATVQQTFTVTGLLLTDIIYTQGPVPTSLCPMTGSRVSAANTLQVDFTVLTAAACTPAAGVYLVIVYR